MYKKTIYNLILNVILLLILIGVFVWMLAYVKDAGSKLKQANEEIQLLKIKERNLSGMNKIVANADEQNAALSKYIIAGDESLQIVEKLENLASQNFLDSTTDSLEIVPDDKLTAISKEYLKLSLSVVGKWQNILNYMDKLEHLPYNFKIKRLSIVSSDATKGTWKLNFEVWLVKEAGSSAQSAVNASSTTSSN